MNRECHVSAREDNGDFVVSYMELVQEAEKDVPYYQEKKCISYESRICALADIQRWILHGTIRTYENDYQKYSRWICPLCGKEITSSDANSEKVCPYCSKER